MIKRIITIACVIALLMTLIPNIASANQEDKETKNVEMLEALNIYPGEKITGDTLIMAMAGFLWDEPEIYGTSEDIGRIIGMIENGEEYKGSTMVLGSVALKYAVITLGYKLQAEQYGGDMNSYVTVASEIGLLSKSGISTEKRVKKDDAVKLICAMMEIAPIKISNKSSGKIEYSTDKNVTLLSGNRDIYKIRGIVTANQYTSIDDVNGATEGSIRIDEAEYLTFKSDYQELIGYDVTAYVNVENGEEPYIVYMEKNDNKNKTVSILAEDISKISDDFSQIEYFENSNVKRVKLADVPKVIFNGVYDPDYIADDFFPNIGNIEAVDNNNDGKYEIIFINSYQTMVVESVSVDDRTITNRYKFSGSLNLLDLKFSEDSVMCEIRKGDTLITIDDINAGDVLSVAKSKSENNPKIIIYVSEREDVVDKINAINDEKEEIMIGNTYYPYTDDLNNYSLYKNVKLKLGNNYEFKFDTFGNIVYFRTAGDEDYHLFLKVYEEDGNYYVVYMNMDEEWKNGRFAKNIKIDETKYTNQTEAFKSLSGLNPQVVKIKENKKGEVSMIDFPQTGGYSENEFTKTTEKSYIYRYQTASLNMELFLNKGAKLVLFPPNLSYRKEDYKVAGFTGYINPYESINATAYDQDEYGFVSILSMKDPKATKVVGPYFVTEKEDKYKNGEICYCLAGEMEGAINLTVSSLDPKVFDNVEKGDFISITMNNEGYALSSTVLFSLNRFTPNMPQDLFAGGTLFVSGNVYSLDWDNERFQLKVGDTIQTFRCSQNVITTIFNENAKTLRKTSLGEVGIGDKIVMRMQDGIIYGVYCVRN